MAALTYTGGAGAAAWPRDPRVCSGTRAQCAAAAAVQAMRRHVGGPGGVYQGDTGCAQQRPATVLRWACHAGANPYVVVFSRSGGRWWVLVTP